jgi:biopolymer transport protein TolR
MGAPLSAASKKKLPEPEMNVTPLVDVVLVLLIIFMVVTPALNDGEHVEVPAFLTPDPKPKDLNPIDVVMAKSGHLLLNQKPIGDDQLEPALRDLHQKEPDRVLLLKADTRLDYGAVRKTFAKIQTIGFKGVSLKVTERQPQGKN